MGGFAVYVACDFFVVPLVGCGGGRDFGCGEEDEFRLKDGNEEEESEVDEDDVCGDGYHSVS